MSSVIRAAKKVKLVWKVDPVIRELYDYVQPIIDEEATLRRVVYLAFGSGRINLIGDQRKMALEIIDERADNKLRVGG